MQSSKFHKNKYKLQHPYQEKDLQAKIGRYLKEFPFNHVAEVKVTEGGTLNFSKFEDQQLPSLLRANSKLGKYHKLTDLSAGSKPFDYMCAVCMPAYIVCQFWKNIQQEICYFLDIKKVMEIKNSGQKSIKETVFMQYGFVINLDKYRK